MGGSGGTFSRHSPSEVARKVREAEQAIDASEFEGRLANRFAQLLGRYNDRDAGLARERIDALTASLEDNIKGRAVTIFGGSVAKHTYVDGLSDIDTLVILDDTNLEDRSPKAALDRLAHLLGAKLEVGARLTIGRIAITIEYKDGMNLQILPALRSDGTLRVPAWRGNEWSAINPEKFQQGLTKRNEACGGKVIPTIKLVKAINATLPEKVQLTGYHIESLAIAAFRGYDGPKSTVAMLPHFFDRAAQLVARPMVDTSGQSVHVDEHLGAANSQARQEMSYVLERIAKRMKNATAAHSIDQWVALFGD